MVENIEKDNEMKGAQFTPMDILHLILSNWYWFIISVALCTLGAWLYMRRTAPIYQRTATVLVKDSRKGSSAEVTAFSDLMGGIGRRSVDNEVYIFESRRLMEQVVMRHNLMTTYLTKGRIRTTDMYGRTPALIKFVDANPHTRGSFKFKLSGNNKVTLSEFNDSDMVINATLGDTIATPLGKIIVRTTPYAERYGDHEITVHRNTLNNTVEAYRKALKCEITNKQASVITLSMVDVVPKRAEDVINGIIEAYNADAIEDKRAISNLTKCFIDERLELLGQELNLADSDIASFKKQNQLYNLSNQATLGAEEIQNLKRQELSLDANLEMAQYILDYTLNSPELSLIPASTVAMSGASSTLASQIDQYNESLLEYKRLLSESSESNPAIIEQQAQLSAVRDIIISSLKSHIDGLKLQIKGINREHKIAEARLDETPTKEKELLSKTRQQKVKEELYIYLLTKLEENALMGATAESNARVIDLAYGADKPVSPRASMIYLFAVMMGCIIPFCIIYLAEILNNTVRSRREIEKAISAPFLGDIPYVSRRAAGAVQIKEDSRDTLSESFRMLRTNLSFMAVNNPVKVIMLTSSIPHSGKTFVSTNLAATLAMTSGRVLLIDLDLRRRTLTKILGHRNDRRGLTTYLSGKINLLNDIISESGIAENVDIIYAGPQPPNPAEMLMSEQMDSLIRELRGIYDYIIIDSVPAMAVADAMIIDRLVDLTMYVIRQGNLDRRQLPDIERLHKSKKFHNLSIVLNGVSQSKHNYGYGYGYGYNTEEDATPWQRRWTTFKRLFKKRD